MTDPSDDVIVERGGVLIRIPADTLIPGGGVAGAEPLTTTQVGSAGAAFFVLGSRENGAVVANPGVDKLHAWPFTVPRRVTLESLAINVRTGSGGAHLRMGIYAATSAGDPYPGALLYDSGAVDSAADGIKTVLPALTLAPNRIYWGVSVLSDNQSMTCHDWGNALIYPFGISAVDNLGNGVRGPLRVDQAYGALPGTFPTTNLLLPTANAGAAHWASLFATFAEA